MPNARDAHRLRDDIAAMAFVQSSSLCHGLDVDCMRLLLETGDVAHLHATATIVSEGSHDDHLYIVLDGHVSVRKQHRSRVVDLAVLERGAVFGESGVLTQYPRSATVVARTDVRLVCWPGPAVRVAADKVPRFGRRLAALMAARQRDTDTKLEPATASDSELRPTLHLFG